MNNEFEGISSNKNDFNATNAVISSEINHQRIEMAKELRRSHIPMG